MSMYETIALKLLSGLTKGSLTITMPDGEVIRIGGGDGSVKATLQIRNSDMFRKSILYGDIGFGESYVDGDWDTDSVTNFISWWILNYENNPALSGSRRKFSPMGFLQFLDRIGHLFRSNTKSGARKNIADHYDLSNDFYSLWLDPSMTYSSAHFRNGASTLEEGQFQKYDRLCRKLRLSADDHVLEIGSGWGGFAVHAVKHYGCRITTITISKEQFAYAQERFIREGVADRVEIKLMDYRDVTGEFDKIVSIEMLEAVGHEFLPAYFGKVQQLLKQNGIAGFQVITSPDARYDEFRKGVDFIQTHIFPGTLLPSIKAMNDAVHRTGEMHLIDLKDFGKDYARTLALWREEFNRKLTKVKELGFDDRFIRKWNYYLSYCEAGFAMRNISVVQMIYSRPNNFSL
ncbi:MAG: class I SAM-dependent methyltransferase [Bacteroidetes bacterium]|nr:class I SAM-dependent methyltransferase [Bacteroidota bacterium]